MTTRSVDMKQPSHIGQPVEEGFGAIEVIHGDTTQDRQDMLRLGKKQEFKRNFSFVSTLGFISIYMVHPKPSVTPPLHHN